MTAPTAVALDPGAHFTRIAHITPDGTPALVELPGTVPGEGLPTPGGAGGHHGTALRAAYAAFRQQYGTPEQVVVVIPQHDRAEQARRATDVLAALHGTDPMPRLRTLGTPHAVLALLRHAGAATGARYAVCDLGATAAEVSLCTLAPGSVAVTATARHAPGDGLAAGFDAALLTGAGLPDEDSARRALAEARASEGAAQRQEIALGRSVRHPGRYDDTVVLEVAGHGVTLGVLRRALDRLTTGLDAALDRVADGQPAAHVIAVGGAARSGPLRRHLTQRRGAPVPLPGGTDPALAAAFGAALVAAGRIDPADRYPYAVFVGTHCTVGGTPRADDLLISPAGALEPGGPTVFAEADGHRVRVRTRPVGATAQRRVPIQVRDASGGHPTPVRAVTVSAAPEGTRFHVGVRLAVDGTAHLVLHPTSSGTPSEHLLGALPTDIEGAHP
ncbi:hypothetical protein [Streptomyces liliifuscus]|uniref:Hsp70 family protein n=1 Tax=Streptomyces liliifuscus TaxID=2797636 RepID=A0A7T7I379_9ACTN|nr:hypothetical protein [Streptomyces liliifuscus]QQM40186.1 hypothetical protein JEQ17_12355 [Streptomyces liliifuscus]